MKRIDAVDTDRRFRRSERDVPAMPGPLGSIRWLEALRKNMVRSRPELVDTGMTLFVWLVTLLVLPAGAWLAMLLSS